MSKRPPAKTRPKGAARARQSSAQSAKPTAGSTAFRTADTWLQGRETWVLCALFTAMAVAIFHDFLFFDKVLLFKDFGSDTLNINLPGMKDIADQLRDTGLPGWSFKQGLGQNTLPGALNEPFKLLLYLPDPQQLPYWIVWVEVLKLFLGGYFFLCYLRLMTVGPLNALVGALLFAFSGYAVIGSCWHAFTTSMVYLALLLWGTERLIRRDSWWLFVVAVALIASSFVYLHLFIVFLTIYLVARYCGTATMTGRQFAGLLLQTAALGTVGCLIAAVFGLPILIEILESPRVAGESSHVSRLAQQPVFGFGDRLYYMTLVMRSFGNDLLGTGSAFQGWLNYLEAPMNYGGVLSLVAAPQLFAQCKGRERIGFAIMLAFYVMMLIFPWFRYAFWLFSGDYFRVLSLFVSTVFVLYTCIALSRMAASNSVNWPLLGATVLLLLVALFVPYSADLAKRVDSAQQGVVALFIVIYAGLVALVASPRMRSVGQFGLLAAVCIELVAFSYPVPNKRDALTGAEMKQKVGYNDYTVDAMRAIKARDKGFYRVHKNFHSSPAMHASLNDGKVQNYYSSASYHSFNQPNYIHFLTAMGIVDPKDERQSRWAPGVDDSPILRAFTAYKYTLYRGPVDKDPLLARTHEEIGKTGDLTLLENKNFIPLGSAFSYCMSQSENQKLDKERRAIALLRAVILPDSEMERRPWLKPITADSIPPSDDYRIGAFEADAAVRKAAGLEPRAPHNPGHLVFDGEFADQQTVLFSIPMDKGWSATVDGLPEPLITVDYGLIGLDVAPGKHSIVLQYRSPMLALGAWLSLLGCTIFGAILLFSYRSRKKSAEATPEPAPA